MKQLLFLALILAYAIMLFTLFACSGINPQPPMNIEQFSLINTIPLGMQTDKILYHSQSNTLYAMSVKNQEIYIFQDGELKNVLGGLGSSKVNFQYLACLLYTSDDADDLLCVDIGGRRLIKKKKHKSSSTLTSDAS